MKVQRAQGANPAKSGSMLMPAYHAIRPGIVTIAIANQNQGVPGVLRAFTTASGSARSGSSGSNASVTGIGGSSQPAIAASTGSSTAYRNASGIGVPSR